MPIEVEGPDGVVIEFPDNTPRATIQGVMAKRYPARQQTAKPAPKPPAQPSARNALAGAAGDVAAGVGNAAAAIPDLAMQGAYGIGRGLNALVGGAGSAILHAGGFNNAARGWDRAVSARDAELSRPPQLGAAVDRALPSDGSRTANVARGLTEFTAGMAIPIPAGKAPIKAPKPRPPVPTNAAREVVQTGKRAGVRVLTSDVRQPKTFMGKAAQAVGERIPFAGTGGVREAQQGERVAAVKSLLQDFGAHDATGAIDEVAADLAKTRGAAITRLTTAKNSVIQAVQGAVPVPQASKAIDDQIARLTGINADAFAPVTGKLNEFRAQLASGKTLDQIEGNRKLLGDLFKDPSLAAIAGDGQKALNAIYGPLRADMGNFIKANAGDAAFAKWQSANNQLAAMAGELSDGTFRKVLSSAEATPENVARLLFSKKPSDVARLYSNMSAAGRAKAQAAVLHQAMNKAGGFEAVSPDQFVNQVKALGRTAGVHFQAPDLARLEGLQRVLEVTKRAAQASVAPPTGVQAVPYAMGAGLTGLLGLQGGMAAGAGIGLLARAYESAPVRNALLRLGKTAAGSPREAVEMQRVITALSIVAERHMGEIGKAANGNTMPALAADPGSEQQPEQQAPLQP
jgi:hypothetical protein